MDDLRPDIKDILLQDIGDEKNRKIKKLLTLIAMVIVLFLIILIVMKFINSKEESFDDDLAISLPISTDKDYEEIEKEIKNESKKPIEGKNDKNIKDILNNYSKPKEVIKAKPNPPIEVEVKPENNSMQVLPQVKPDPAPAPAPAPAPKPAAPKPAPVPAPKPAPKPAPIKTADLFPTKASSNIQKGTYIQIASTTKLDPNSPLLKTLQSKAYKYTLYSTKINGVNYTKVLIGPYASDADYQKALVDARQNLHDQAYRFIVN